MLGTVSSWQILASDCWIETKGPDFTKCVVQISKQVGTRFVCEAALVRPSQISENTEI